MGGSSNKGAVKSIIESSPHERPFLHVSIDSPILKMSLSSESPDNALKEVRHIIKALSREDGVESGLILDDMYEFRSRLSNEFFNYPVLGTRLKNAQLLEEDVNVLKTALPISHELDLESGKSSSQVDAISIKENINQLFDQLEDGYIRDCLVHIRGKLSREQQTIIMDCIRQRVGVDVQPRFFSTKKNLENKALIEVVCFGENLHPLMGD